SQSWVNSPRKSLMVRWLRLAAYISAAPSARQRASAPEPERVIIQVSRVGMLTGQFSLTYEATEGGRILAAGNFLDEDRLFDAEPQARTVARALYAGIKDLPLISPHGHTDPRWYAENGAFPDPAQLLIVPDHYIFRMLCSQGVRLEDLGVPTTDGSA